MYIPFKITLDLAETDQVFSCQIPNFISVLVETEEQEKYNHVVANELLVRKPTEHDGDGSVAVVHHDNKQLFPVT